MFSLKARLISGLFYSQNPAKSRHQKIIYFFLLFYLVIKKIVVLLSCR